MTTTDRTALRPPLLLGAAGVAVLAAVAVRDPHVQGSWGTCPFLAATGLPCAGCGGLRATHDLLHGDVGAALAQNALAVVAVVGAVVLWSRWVRRRRTDPTAPLARLGSGWAVAAVAVLVVFTVVRWTPAGAVLGP